MDPEDSERSGPGAGGLPSDRSWFRTLRETAGARFVVVIGLLAVVLVAGVLVGNGIVVAVGFALGAFFVGMWIAVTTIEQRRRSLPPGDG